MRTISVVDYGVGNLSSVAQVVEYCDAKVHFISKPEEVLKADQLVLPGVGAFKDGIAALKQLNLIESIVEYAQSGKPFMGICLGLQFLLDESEEHGNERGLGLVKGKVRKIMDRDVSGMKLKVPHVGWNQLFARQDSEYTKHLTDDEWAYFVHSYVAEPENPSYKLFEVEYGGHSLCAAIQKDNVAGFQFHPERSGKTGIKIMKVFIEA